MPKEPKRIMIFGLPGSGKSTFAIRLARCLHLPVVHLDKYFFIHNWNKRDHEEFLQIQREFVAKEAWIIDGNATRSFEIRFERADCVLYFRVHRCLCLYRIFKRLLFKDPSILDRAEGCREKVRFVLIRYMWGFHKRVQKTIEEFKIRYPEVPFYELRTQKDVESLLTHFVRSSDENSK